MDVVNGRRCKSIEVKWAISSQSKVITLKIINIKAGVTVPETPAKTTVPAQITDKHELQEDLSLPRIVTVTWHEIIASDAFAFAREQTWTTQNCHAFQNKNTPMKTCRVICYLKQHLSYRRDLVTRLSLNAS